jgi:hypothetical protein
MPANIVTVLHRSASLTCLVLGMEPEYVSPASYHGSHVWKRIRVDVLPAWRAISSDDCIELGVNFLLHFWKACHCQDARHHGAAGCIYSTTNQVAHEACNLHIRHIAALLRSNDVLPKVVSFRLSAFLCK